MVFCRNGVVVVPECSVLLGHPFPVLLSRGTFHGDFLSAPIDFSIVQSGIQEAERNLNGLPLVPFLKLCGLWLVFLLPSAFQYISYTTSRLFHTAWRIQKVLVLHLPGSGSLSSVLCGFSLNIEKRICNYAILYRSHLITFRELVNLIGILSCVSPFSLAAFRLWHLGSDVLKHEYPCLSESVLSFLTTDWSFYQIWEIFRCPPLTPLCVCWST